MRGGAVGTRTKPASPIKLARRRVLRKGRNASFLQKYTHSITTPSTVHCECQYVQDVSSRRIPEEVTKLWSESSQRPVTLCSTSATRSPFRNASYGSRSATPRV